MKFTLLTDFRNDERGGILAFYIIMFLTMMIGGGMAIDFIRHEIQREAMQSALDRGVLAATGNAQTSNPLTPSELATAEQIAIDTVRSYVQIAGFNPDTQGVVVTPVFSPTSKRINVVSTFSVDTYFLRLSGIDVLNGNAASAATLAANQIELSLIVDISASMEGAKIANLRSAATNFANLMLAGNRSDYTSLSLVPFSGQVAAPDSIMQSYNYNRWHTYSSCVDFAPSDFSTLAIGRSTPLTQTKHWSTDGVGGQGIRNGSYFCPKDRLAILPLSNSLTDVNNAISRLVATGETASDLGMKWGVNLLDPDSQFLVDDLITRNAVNPIFAGRPAAYTDQTTLKFAILMTDGANSTQWDILNDPAAYYQYQGYEVLLDPNKNPGQSPNYLARMEDLIANGDWYEARVPASGQRTASIWDDRVNYPMAWDYNHITPRVGPAEADNRLQSICQLAKDAGIVIFSIAYDVAPGSNAYNQMNNCASAGQFYNAGTDSLDAAFDGIYQTIQKLKLTF